MVLIRVLVLFALMVTAAASADSFDVQIGAFRHPDVSKITLPDNVGELRSTSGPDGLTRFVVGPFESRDAAKQALKALRSAGYRQAFIRSTQDRHATTAISARTGAKNPSASSTPGTDHKSDQKDISEQDLRKLMNLSEEERRDLVLLDGRLHRKVGDTFVPLTDE